MFIIFPLFIFGLSLAGSIVMYVVLIPLVAATVLSVLIAVLQEKSTKILPGIIFIREKKFTFVKTKSNPLTPLYCENEVFISLNILMQTLLIGKNLFSAAISIKLLKITSLYIYSLLFPPTPQYYDSNCDFTCFTPKFLNYEKNYWLFIQKRNILCDKHAKFIFSNICFTFLFQVF